MPPVLGSPSPSPQADAMPTRSAVATRVRPQLDCPTTCFCPRDASEANMVPIEHTEGCSIGETWTRARTVHVPTRTVRTERSTELRRPRIRPTLEKADGEPLPALDPPVPALPSFSPGLGVAPPSPRSGTSRARNPAHPRSDVPTPALAAAVSIRDPALRLREPPVRSAGSAGSNPQVPPLRVEGESS